MSGKHPSHKTRCFWGDSTFDEICELCGATDQVPGGWRKLAYPCTGKKPEKTPATEMAELLKELDGCFCDDYGQPECRRCGEIRARMLELEGKAS